MKIRPFKIFKHSLQEVWLNRLAWTRVMFAPWMILLVGYICVIPFSLDMNEFVTPLLSDDMGSLFFHVTGGPSFFVRGDDAPRLKDILYCPVLLLIIFELISVASMTINGYRYALLGEGGTRWWTFPLNRRLVKMIVYIMIMAFLSGFLLDLAWGPGKILWSEWGVFSASTLSLPYSAVPSLVGICVFLLGVSVIFPLGANYTLRRLCFFDLAIALDKSSPFCTSWLLLKRNVWRLFGLFLLVYLPVFGMECGLEAILERFVPFPLSWVPSVLFTPLSVAMIAQSFSTAYRDITQEK